MDDSASPLLLRRRLRTELRTARLEKGLTQEQVAKAMEWSLSKMNRIEKAKTGISANDLKALLPLYGVTGEEHTEELLALARRARQPTRWRHYSDVAPATLLDLIDYESAASAISQFEPMFVPGIMQTEEYALAVLRIFYGEDSEAERVPALVDLRTRRRDLLDSEDAPKFSFLLDESVIRRLVGSPAIISRQFTHMVDLADLANVTIRVVPFTAGPDPGMRGPFKVIEFDDSPDENVVFLEGPRGDVISDDPEETRSYLETFARITQMALEPSDSVSLLRKAAGEMTLPLDRLAAPAVVRAIGWGGASLVLLPALHCSLMACLASHSVPAGSSWYSIIDAPAGTAGYRESTTAGVDGDTAARRGRI